MRRGWSRASVFAVVVAIAVASGFLNDRPGVSTAAASAPAMSFSVSLAPLALEVRTADLAIKIKI
ncbi:hypothetical protein [Terricaulis sp.]|uniref:hypothetical protein n=1 Tax=Terricaulis sp. TaxID=2768686 RepID=UPI002AC4198A|nr:hypothetical protein [Terricaulis sp.]MDZ4692951.1 hypothetical protein [Terricaulis sp.]